MFDIPANQLVKNIPYIILVLVLVACGGNGGTSLPTTPTSISSNSIRIENRDTQRIQFTTNLIPLENCNGNRPVSLSFSRTQSVTTTTELGIGTEIEVGVKEIATVKIQAEYNIQNGETISASQEYQVEVDGGTKVDYEIKWYETWQTGDVVIEQLSLRIPFRVKTGLEGELSSGIPAMCPTLTVTATSTTQPPSPTIIKSDPTSTFSNIATSTPIPYGDTFLWTPLVREFNEIRFVFVPRGCFEMGWRGSDEGDEYPHIVCLDSFWISETEISNRQYRRCMNDGSCREPKITAYFNDSTLIDHPVTAITWQDALSFSEWAGGGLPTEAQWEYAARGPEARQYPWGEEIPTCELANIQNCYQNIQSTTSLNQMSGASWVGALSMAGNVSEWVFDFYSYDYYRSLEPYTWNPNGPEEMPQGQHVIRGGSWLQPYHYARSSFRNFLEDPLKWDTNVGFRVVLAESMITN